MPNDVYGNVRQEMKAMKEERRRCIPELKAKTHQIQAQARQFMDDKDAENAELKAETHQIQAQARQFMDDKHAENAELKAEVSQTLDEMSWTLGEYAQASHERATAWKKTLDTVRGRR